ncbi:MAG: glycosyltransferase family 2 protein [Candidatus Omnitrophica bacterium]|nr:glycosyltransferase family 2 protein [Candidatus Omnitrophota bacterium]
MAQTISIITNTKNEEGALPKFFQQHAWADEILVMDSFSTDATIDICKKFGHRFYQAELTGNTNSRHNLALTLFKCDWAFFLDPDEFISDELKQQIREILSAADDKYAAYEFPRINFFMDRPLYHGGWSGNTLRFFRKNSVKFDGDAYHDRPVVKGRIGHLSGVAYHYPNPNIYWITQKFNYISEFDLKGYYNKFGVLSERKFKWLLLTKPLKIFWKGYVKKKGYKDGLHGFIYAALIWAFDIMRICKYGEKYLVKNPNILAEDKLADPWACRK